MNGKRRRAWLLQPRFDGECHASSDRRPGGRTATGKSCLFLATAAFTMMMGDFITLSQLNLPVKIVVFNNGSLGFVAMEMKAGGYLDTGTDLEKSKFCRHGERDGHQRDTRGKLRRCRRGAASASIIQTGAGRCRHRKTELVMPPKIKRNKPRALASNMLKPSSMPSDERSNSLAHEPAEVRKKKKTVKEPRFRDLAFVLRCSGLRRCLLCLRKPPGFHIPCGRRCPVSLWAGKTWRYA